MAPLRINSEDDFFLWDTNCGRLSILQQNIRLMEIAQEENHCAGSFLIRTLTANWSDYIQDDWSCIWLWQIKMPPLTLSMLPSHQIPDQTNQNFWMTTINQREMQWMDKIRRNDVIPLWKTIKRVDSTLYFPIIFHETWKNKYLKNPTKIDLCILHDVFLENISKLKMKNKINKNVFTIWHQYVPQLFQLSFLFLFFFAIWISSLFFGFYSIARSLLQGPSRLASLLHFPEQQRNYAVPPHRNQRARVRYLQTSQTS